MRINDTRRRCPVPRFPVSPLGCHQVLRHSPYCLRDVASGLAKICWVTLSYVNVIVPRSDIDPLALAKKVKHSQNKSPLVGNSHLFWVCN